MIGRPPLDLENPPNRLRVRSVGSESVDGFGRESNHLSGREKFRGFSDFINNLAPLPD
jgi:hypothetical protein